MIVNNGNVIALKFGIATNAKSRRYSLQSYCVYTVKLHAVYTFPSTASCKSAERECKEILECGIITKAEIEQGWTETTHVYNLEKIIAIYEKNGGILLA